MFVCVFFYANGYPLDLHVLTHSFPTRRSSDLSRRRVNTVRSTRAEAFLVGGVRTPMGRYGGVLASIRPDDLAALVMAELVVRTGIDPAALDQDRKSTRLNSSH